MFFSAVRTVSLQTLNTTLRLTSSSAKRLSVQRARPVGGKVHLTLTGNLAGATNLDAHTAFCTRAGRRSLYHPRRSAGI